jgi:hypothetical protein
VLEPHEAIFAAFDAKDLAGLAALVDSGWTPRTSFSTGFATSSGAR